MLKLMLLRIRGWDRDAARRVTYYIANSEVTRQRISDFYGRDAIVVHPPVETERFSPGEPGDSFLVVTELTRHKRVEVALEAARRISQPITVVGEGPELRRLKGAFGSTARFLGSISDQQLAQLYARARALIVPNEEEFGIAAVEAQAAGRPVVALAAGGANETVIDGETGILVSSGRSEAFAEVLRETDFDAFSPERIREHAQQFSRDRFKRRLIEAIEGFIASDSQNPELLRGGDLH